jgi:hypothetical protein
MAMNINITVNDLLASRLKGQLYGLLCEYEKERDWEAFWIQLLLN